MSLQGQAKEILDRIAAKSRECDETGHWDSAGEIEANLGNIFDVGNYRNAQACERRLVNWAGHEVKRVLGLGADSDDLAAAIIEEMRYRGEIVPRKIGTSMRWVHCDTIFADKRFHFDESDPDRLAETISTAEKTIEAEWKQKRAERNLQNFWRLLRDVGPALPATVSEAQERATTFFLSRQEVLAFVQSFAADGRIVLEGDAIVEVRQH